MAAKAYHTSSFTARAKILTDTNLMAAWDCTVETFGLSASDSLIMLVSVIVLLFVDIMQERMKLRDALAEQNIIFRWIIIYAGLFSIILFGVYGPAYDAASFIYEQF